MINWELSKMFKSDHMNKWYMHKHKIRPRKWDAQNSLGFWDTNGSLNPTQTTKPGDSQQKKKKKKKKRKRERGIEQEPAE